MKTLKTFLLICFAALVMTISSIAETVRIRPQIQQTWTGSVRYRVEGGYDYFGTDIFAFHVRVPGRVITINRDIAGISTLGKIGASQEGTEFTGSLL